MAFGRRLLRHLGAGMAAFAGMALAPAEAQACGGFFCSVSPVDQTAEHIVFTVNGDHTVTAYVQIKYAGDKDDFAWIIPAPGVPTLNTDMPDAAMRALDTATQPRYFKNTCNSYGVPTSAIGLGGPQVTAPGADNGGVTVLATQSVGPFDTVTLEGTSADVLVQWLNDNGYRITQKMIPLIQPYVESGMHFVAMKLQADKNVSDITPIGMTYDSDQPLIPLQLTSVAAQPEMGIVTFILADKRWAPQNYIDLKIPDSLIQFDQYGNQNNYLRLVSSESDKVGGQAFVTEYAKATTDLATQIGNMFVNPNIQGAEAAQTELTGLLNKFPYLTRLYARISAEEMTLDPVFMVSSQTGDVDNVHDLTDPGFSYQQCTGQIVLPLPPEPCTFAYCGRRGSCVSLDAPLQGQPDTTMPTAACACASDATARLTTTGDNGQAAIYCESVSVNFDDPGADAATTSPACEGFSCGAHGACVAMNGNPTCQCEAGYAAIVGPSTTTPDGSTATSIDCRQLTSAKAPPLPVLPPVGQTTIPSSSGGSDGSGGSGAMQTPPASGGSGGAASTSAPSSGAAPAAAPTTSTEPHSSQSSSGCSVGRAPAKPAVGSLLVAFAAAAAARRRRKASGRS
ncbi:MAG TPA: DUF2330 domain-containing protein [Polyangiaceae bacterium]|nr:DUF2330 domain-containing protein [Polyangiaceae bacterium]